MQIIAKLILLMLSFSLSANNEESYWYTKLDKKTHINKNGEILNLNFNVDSVTGFNNNYAVIFLKSESIKPRGVIINNNGKLIFDPLKMNIENISPFYSEGLFGAKKNGKWGYINIQGKWVIPPQYEMDFPDEFKDNRARVKIGNDYVFIDKTGKVIDPTPDYSYGPFSEKMARVSEKGVRFSKQGYIDINCKLIIPIEYTDALDFSEGVAAVRKIKNSKWFFIDKQGKK